MAFPPMTGRDAKYKFVDRGQVITTMPTDHFQLVILTTTELH